MIKLLLDKQIFASSEAIMAATRKILSTTRTILALTWFCHLSIYLWSLGGGAWGAPRGDPHYTWKKLQCQKMIFRPFGAKKIKKNWIWKMTLADPPSPPLVWNFPYFFNPSLMNKLIYLINSSRSILHHCGWQH